MKALIAIVLSLIMLFGTGCTVGLEQYQAETNAITNKSKSQKSNGALRENPQQVIEENTAHVMKMSKRVTIADDDYIMIGFIGNKYLYYSKPKKAIAIYDTEKAKSNYLAFDNKSELLSENMSMQVCGSETEYYIYNENIALLISENEIKETYDFTEIFFSDISKGYIIQPYPKDKKAVLYNITNTFVSDYSGNKSKIDVENVSKAQWVDENNILLAAADNDSGSEFSNYYIVKYDISSSKTTDKLSLSASVNLELYKTSDQYGYIQYAEDAAAFNCIGFVNYATGDYNKYKWAFLNESAQMGYNSKYLVMANSVDGISADVYICDCENQTLYKSEESIKSVDNLYRDFTNAGQQMKPSTYHVGNIQVSANGEMIAFENAKNRNIELYVVD